MIYKEINTGALNEDKRLISHNHDSSSLCPSSSDCVDRCPLSRYCVDMCPLSKYYVGMCPLSRYCVDICPHSSYFADRFCWFLAVSLVNYNDMYGLIYQLLTRQNNLSHVFDFT